MNELCISLVSTYDMMVWALVGAQPLPPGEKVALNKKW